MLVGVSFCNMEAKPRASGVRIGMTALAHLSHITTRTWCSHIKESHAAALPQGVLLSLGYKKETTLHDYETRVQTITLSPHAPIQQLRLTRFVATQDNSSNSPLCRQHKTYIQAGHRVSRIPQDAVFRYRKTNDNSETTGYRFATIKNNRPVPSAFARCRIARTLQA